MNQPSNEIKTYSISIRIKRTTVEHGFVKVLVTDDLIDLQPDGTGRLNVEKVFERGIEMGNKPDVAWGLEDQIIETHPIQSPPPGIHEA
jgi:hypothetical protein